MKRDMDLVRDLLILFEERLSPSKHYYFPHPDSRMEFPDLGLNRSPDEIFYHIRLLHEASLIGARFDGYGWTVHSLTWSGHEFINAARDDTTWNKAKQKVGAKLDTLTFELLKALLVGLVTKAFDLG